VLMGMFLLKEKGNAVNKLIGAVSMVTGAILLV
jgi:hypothetical protein